MKRPAATVIATYPRRPLPTHEIHKNQNPNSTFGTAPDGRKHAVGLALRELTARAQALLLDPFRGDALRESGLVRRPAIRGLACRVEIDETLASRAIHDLKPLPIARLTDGSVGNWRG